MPIATLSRINGLFAFAYLKSVDALDPYSFQSFFDVQHATQRNEKSMVAVETAEYLFEFGVVDFFVEEKIIQKIKFPLQIFVVVGFGVFYAVSFQYDVLIQSFEIL
jgi:hypothetical protein